MKFKKGKLYRVIKRISSIWKCRGCVIKYEGKDEYGRHWGTPRRYFCKEVKRTIKAYRCKVFHIASEEPYNIKLVELESMIKFCKKLKKKLDKERKV